MKVCFFRDSIGGPGTIAVIFMMVFSLTCGGMDGEQTRPNRSVILIDGVAAEVNAEVITVADLLSVMDPVRRQLAEKYRGEELEKRLRAAYEDALSTLVDRRLILDAYEKEQRKIPDWVVEKRIEQVIHESFDGDQEGLLSALTEDRLTFDDWRERVEEQIVVSSMRSAYVERFVRVSPVKVKDFYDRNRDKYVSPEKIRIRMIVIDKEESENDSGGLAEKAREVRKMALAREDFAALAKEYSVGNKAEDGGDWGWIEPGTLRSELQQAVKTMGAGDISDLVETETHFYILKLEGRKEADMIPFAEVYADIRDELRERQAEELYKNWIARLKRVAYVRTAEVELF